MAHLNLTTVDLPSMLAQLHRASVGYDRMFNDLNRSTTAAANTEKYPPHNIIEVSETEFVIELATAGYSESELDLSIEKNVLTVTGQITDQSEKSYIHRGISRRPFTKTFALAEHVIISDATYVNGMLTVYLKVIVPEELKPRKISINSTPALTSNE